MLTDSQLKSNGDALWNKVWTGGLSNPVDAIEQLPVPSLPWQQKFAALVERHEHLCATQRGALRQAERLFQTLLHRAFSTAS